MALGGLVQLDTNILVHLVRGSVVGRRVDDELGLSERTERPLISIVTVGEMGSLATKFGWGSAKRETLDRLIRQLVIIQLHQGDIVQRYAEIDHFSEREMRPARRMGQNDMWIAATASAFAATLITTDADFDHLSPRFVSRVRVNAHSGEILAV